MFVGKGVPRMFWDPDIRLKARGGGCLHSLYCWKKLCCARLSISAQMLESGNSPKTGYWLETRIWLGFDAAGNWTLKGMHKSTYSSFSAISRSCSLSCLETGGKLPPILLHDGNCLENLDLLGKLGLTRYWKRARWLRFNFTQQVIHIYTIVLFILSFF